MEYVPLILMLLFLVFLLFLITGIDRRTKNKWRKSAYDLLEMRTPEREEIVKTIKHLRLYGGRLRKDKEFMQLISRLQDRLASLEENE
ncbi:MAG: hypothetical protein JXA51_04280 [Dehalococcoidales bacterium]|nr:hypothetical protein [Dehalococcoidales bacterium]